MYDDLGLLVLRLAIGGIVIAHGFIKIGWPISFGNRGTAAVRGVAGFFGGLGFWPPMFWAITSIIFLRGLELYERRADKAYSLVDCISMNSMRDEGITEILTSDHHFAQEGYTVLLRK